MIMQGFGLKYMTPRLLRSRNDMFTSSPALSIIAIVQFNIKFATAMSVQSLPEPNK